MKLYKQEHRNPRPFIDTNTQTHENHVFYSNVSIKSSRERLAVENGVRSVLMEEEEVSDLPSQSHLLGNVTPWSQFSS